ncbi:MAG: HEAT repeat domain-containing protein [Patescibacteria group bacterium]|nr:HEAT repeat domain-containing protein [Patescibacteria group bacterium]
MKKYLLPLLGVTLVIFFLFTFFLMIIIIGKEVKGTCEEAVNRYPGDCTSALILYLDDPKNDFHSRNSAIWALGQLGSAQALPVLEKYYTGNIPAKESLEKGLSQYGLKKAIKLAKGEFNISRLFWEKIISLPAKKISLKEELEKCLPMSNWTSKERCDQLLAGINNFEECAAAGFLIMESFPEQCRLPDGRTFVNN